MSCRTSPAGSLATTFVQRLYGLEDAQCTSLFHQLRREHSTGALPEANDHQYWALLNQMSDVISTDPTWSPVMRARALERVDRTRAAGLPAAGIRTAFVHLWGASRTAAERIDQTLARFAELEGMPIEEIRAEFQRLHRSHRTVLATGNAFDFSQVALRPGVPGDPATVFAVGALTRGERCTECGQFISNYRHACPPRGTGRRATAALRSASRLPAITVPTPPVAAPVSEDVTAWDLDAFQTVYDKAREQIANGERMIPKIESPLAGQVTAGLGSREGGNSFGIELEIDFPDDDWPYDAREMFARRLHAEGIVDEPYVQRWHYIGDDRPGGNYRDDPNGWICEFDRSVDDVDGERGVEIKSQILFDEPQTWHNLDRICAIAREMGGAATPRTGLHVNVGGSGFSSEDPAAHNALLRLAGAYDDTLIRLAHNPESAPVHRGRSHCAYAPVPPGGYDQVARARSYSNHYQAFNLGHLPAAGERARTSSRVEVRLWDSTLDPGRIQAAVTSSLAIVKLGLEGVAPGQDLEPAGTHRQRYGRNRLSGDDWDSSTESFRRFVTLMDRAGAGSEHHREALTKMFAVTRWQNM